MAYATAENLRGQAEATDPRFDSVITDILEAASQAIDFFTNRKDGYLADSTATARLFTSTGANVIPIDECVAITAVAVKADKTSTTYTAWATTDWLAFSGDPQFPNYNRVPYTGLMTDAGGDYATFTSGLVQDDHGNLTYVPTVQVTAKWGYSVTVPYVVKQATITQAARWYQRGKSLWADTQANGEFGVVQYRQALDPDIKMMLVNARLVSPSV